ETLCRRYPDHALVLRNVDAREVAVRHAYQEAGWRLILNRPVHEWKEERLRRHARSNIKSELNLLQSPDVTITQQTVLAPGDEKRITHLYRILYLEKPSRFNPHYTPRFFRSLHDTGFARFTTIRTGGQISAFATLFDDGPRIVANLVGYDTHQDTRQHPH